MDTLSIRGDAERKTIGGEIYEEVRQRTKRTLS